MIFNRDHGLKAHWHIFSYCVSMRISMESAMHTVCVFQKINITKKHTYIYEWHSIPMWECAFDITFYFHTICRQLLDWLSCNTWNRYDFQAFLLWLYDSSWLNDIRGQGILSHQTWTNFGFCIRIQFFKLLSAIFQFIWRLKSYILIEISWNWVNELGVKEKKRARETFKLYIHIHINWKHFRFATRINEVGTYHFILFRIQCIEYFLLPRTAIVVRLDTFHAYSITIIIGWIRIWAHHTEVSLALRVYENIEISYKNGVLFSEQYGKITIRLILFDKKHAFPSISMSKCHQNVIWYAQLHLRRN